MTPEEFDAFWQAYFPATAPLSYVFKRDYAARWVRFHSLPASKRYPETEQEWAALLARQQTILDELVGPDAPLWLLTGEYELMNADSEVRPLLQRYAFTELTPVDLHRWAYSPQVPAEYLPGERQRLFGAELTWQAEALTPILRAFALDDMHGFFVAPSYPHLIAPYDGGIDLILPDTPARDAYRARHREWLSARPDGL